MHLLKLITIILCLNILSYQSSALSYKNLHEQNRFQCRIVEILNQKSRQSESLIFLSQVQKQLDLLTETNPMPPIITDNFVLDFFRNRVFERYAYSFFIPYQSRPWSKVSDGSFLFKNLLIKLKMADRRKINLVNMTPEMLLAFINDPEKRTNNGSIKLEIMGDVELQLGFITDELTYWLINQKNKSVSSEQLFEKALEIYDGDALLALGVISGIFYLENAMSQQRGVTTPLAAKMTNLLDGTKDPIGDNYHFWGYLLLALNGDGLMAKSVSLSYEIANQLDFDDYKVDQMAINIGSAIRHSVLNPNSECN